MSHGTKKAVKPPEDLAPCSATNLKVGTAVLAKWRDGDEREAVVVERRLVAPDAAPPARKRSPRRGKAAAAEAAATNAAPLPVAALTPVTSTITNTEATAPTDPPAPRNEDERRQQAIDLALETVEALITERGADDKIWGSMVKQTLKRRRPGFAEGYYGYRSFNELLEDARDRGLLALEHDEKSGGYVIRLL
jgi:hypothetical protein